MRYHDFDISLTRRSDGSYTVDVINSPCGEARAEFVAPLSDLELENFRLKLGRSRSAVRSVRQSDGADIRTYGTRLYESLMKGEVEACFRSSLTKVQSDDPDAGLRVRLRLRGAAELALLPWEFIYQPSSRTYLAMREDTPLVRYLELGEPLRPLTLTLPLRVLVVISSPADLPQLDAEGEWERLQQSLAALETRGLVSLHRLDSATVRELRWELKRNDYHALHYIGHGGVTAGGEGILMFEDDDRGTVELSAEKLGVLLREERTLRLVVLNACEGAAASSSDIFSGTAQSLILQGIPAVVAMQFQISDSSALTFSHEFYQALAQGDPIDSAVTWARRAMFTQGDELEWGTPVLYMRSSDGRLFRVDPNAAAAPPPRPAADPPPRAVPPSPPRAAADPPPVPLPLAAMPPRKRWWRRRRVVVGALLFLGVILAGLYYVHVPNREGEALRAGYGVVRPWHQSQLDDRDSVAYSVALLPNTRYLVLGACDRTCDLNVYVARFGAATHPSRTPELQFDTGEAPGTTTVVVRADRCSTEPCYFGWGLYARALE